MEGRNEVEKKRSPGRSAEATNSDHIAKVRETLEKDRRWTCDEIAQEVGISHGSVYTILTTKLNVRRVAAR